MLRQEWARQVCFKTVYERTHQFIKFAESGFIVPNIWRAVGKDSLPSCIFSYQFHLDHSVAIHCAADGPMGWYGICPLWTMLWLSLRTRPCSGACISWSCPPYWNCWFLFFNKEIDPVALWCSLRQHLLTLCPWGTVRITCHFACLPPRSGFPGFKFAS